MANRSWQKPLLAQLRKWAANNFPLQFPVRCYVRPAEKMDNAEGLFEIDDDELRGVITISDSHRSRGELIETFIEEWAHARTIFLVDRTTQETIHDPTFWAEKGKISDAIRKGPDFFDVSEYEE